MSDATPPDRLAALQASPLSQGLTPEQLGVLAGVMRLEAVAARTVIGAEGAADDCLYSVVDGSLGVIKHLGTPDEALLVMLAPGDLAHELGFLDGTQRHASLVAQVPSRVLVLERAALEGLIDAHPRLVFRVMCAIVSVVHRIQTRMAVQAVELTNYVYKQHGRY
jgi:CRP-like cAMP-binding protein